VGLTGLDDQNTKQAPIPENPKELIEGGEEVSVHDGREGIVARTRGAVLGITQRTESGVFDSTLLTSGRCVGGWEARVTWWGVDSATGRTRY
jgi:hypothetical protein